MLKLITDTKKNKKRGKLKMRIVTWNVVWKAIPCILTNCIEHNIMAIYC